MDDDIAAGLADTIRALRRQLTTAMAAGKDQQLLFEVGDVQLEFEVAITKDGSADGGVRFGVISFGARGSLADARTPRIALSLQPITIQADGSRRRAAVGDRLGREPTT